jgi:hypothetical protein
MKTVRVSERVHGILTYASEVYEKSISIIVEKLIDAPLNVIPLEDRQILRKEEPKEPSNLDLIKQGLALLQDLDSENVEACRKRLKENWHQFRV